MDYFLDSSVIGSYYFPEQFTSQTVKLMRSFTYPPAINPLVEVEFYSALSKKLRTKQLIKENASIILKNFKEHLTKHFYRKAKLLSADFNLAKKWLSLFNTKLRTQDALLLATAYREGLTLLTYDPDQAHAANILGIKAQNLLPTYHPKRAT